MANWWDDVLPRVGQLLAPRSANVPATQRSLEGQYRPGPYALEDGFLSARAGRWWNFWQNGWRPEPYSQTNAMLEACISAYAQTIAMCPGSHWITNPDGGRTRVTTSALSRILTMPNDYQSASDLLLNLTWNLFKHGESFALGIRNQRQEIDELHLMRRGKALIAVDGSIFYSLGGNEVVENRLDLSFPVPARDVLHIRLHTPTSVLKGCSPILAATLDLAMSGAAMSQQVAFYLNEARPSFILETDEKLTEPEAKDLRRRWHQQTQGENAGGTPILGYGIKAHQLGMSAHDAALAEMLKMSNENIALAFRIPLPILGMGQHTFASTEALMQSWIAGGVGFTLNHIESAFDRLFGLRGQPLEYTELDTYTLLRSSFKERIEALSAGTRRLYTINEARALEGLPRVVGGDEIRVQQQDVPLTWAMNNPPQQQLPPPQDAANDTGRGDAAAVVATFRSAHDRSLSA